MLRHEGKLTGLAAYGEPEARRRDGGAASASTTTTGLIETDFSNWAAMREKIPGDLPGARPRDHRGLDPEGGGGFHRAVGALVARAHRRAQARAGGRAVRQRAAQPAARRDPAGSTRCSSFRRWATTACRSARRSPSCTRATAPRPGCRHRHRLDDVYLGQDYDGRIDDALAGRRHAAPAGRAGRDRGRSDPRRQGGRDLHRPHGVRPARARRPLDHREPARSRHQRQSQQAARPLRVHAVRALCAGGGRRRACSRSPT